MIRNKALTAFQQMELAGQQQSRLETIARDNATDEFRKAELLRREQNTAATQAGVDEARKQRQANFEQSAADRAAARQATEDERKANRERLEEQRALSQAQTISGAYNSNATVQQFQKLATQYKTSRNYLLDADGNPRPTKDLNAVGDLPFTDAYLKLAHPQGRINSVYEFKQIDKLPGMPTRIVQSLKNLAYGKELPPQIRIEMFNAMDRAFKEHNDNQIEHEDSELAKVQALRGLPKGTNPEIYVPMYSIRPEREAKAGAAAAAPAGGGKPDGTIEKSASGAYRIWRNGQPQPYTPPAGQ
jgi:multidrug efflux pump subunit AcrA (membrane-fusion protein)